MLTPPPPPMARANTKWNSRLIHFFGITKNQFLRGKKKPKQNKTKNKTKKNPSLF